ncbi:sugar ABC transporter substrate-binding protein [Vineibacter terrae]|uniref:sugar ABC transporter substrate-binding protein n=1 Tax=Vineibacter terrae TaxID=2586908 RepID=UPI002E3720B9|nr:sugar ABC transporter substrate-binding protein [Vineibacter terrae]HEX2889251.1 sugar ABC transporter substrate-binding protein [Vineibacter terrae]
MIRTLRAWAAATALLGLAVLCAQPTSAQEPRNYVFVTHALAGQPFWQSVKIGMDDACALVKARCQMLFIQTRGNLDEQLTNLKAAVAQRPNGIVVTLPNNRLYNDVVNQARAENIPVLAINVDITDKGVNNQRQAFIGQDLEQAGYDLAKAMSARFPKNGPVHLLVGVSAPGQIWAEQRAAGVVRFMEEYKKANAGRDITWHKLDSTTDLAQATSRVMAYIDANPKTTGYLDMGYWHTGVATTLRSQGVPPGKILIGGFDLVPAALAEMKTGYVQFQVDQQPYLQGYLPVIQLHLMNNFKLSAWDVNTGRAVVQPSEIDAILELSKKGVR